MYILQTRPNKEEDTAIYLRKKGFNVIVPKSKRLERSKKTWFEKERIIFPSYIFINKKELTDEDYYKIKHCSFVYRFLNEDNKPYLLNKSEEDFIFCLNKLNKVLKLESLSLFKLIEINGLKLQVLLIDKRRQRAKFRIMICGEAHIITLSYKLKEDELKDKESIHSSFGFNSDIK